MKVLPVLMFCAVGLTRPAFGQAYGESIQISQPAVRNVGTASTVPAAPLNNSRSGLPQQGGVQVVNDMYRGVADCHCAQAPMFLPSPREVPSGTQVILSSPSPTAVIYFTTDGWTPTEASARYHDPIVITANMRVQAFAEEPGKAPSPVVAASYTISGPAVPLPVDASVAGSTVTKGMQIRFQTGNRVTSETANVGDQFYLLLDQNLVVNGKTIARRGMSVEARVTAVQHAGQNGKSGVIAFTLMGLSVHGVSIPLSGTYTLVAPDIGLELNHITDSSFIHVSGPLPPGNEAKIEPGMMLTASVAADVLISQ